MPLASPATVRSPVLINRYHKLFPHSVLPKVDWSIYIDGNFRITGDISELVMKTREAGRVLACPRHPARSTIVDEIEACEAFGKFDELDRVRAREQLSFYKKEGFPLDHPLSANYLIIRNHQAPDMDTVMRLWWRQLLLFTKRDQISLPYVMWKTNLAMLLLEENASAPNRYFTSFGHREKGLSGLWQEVRWRQDQVWWARTILKVWRRLRS